MANFRRKRPHTCGRTKRYDKWKAKRREKAGLTARYSWWMNSWPAWWDIVLHRRPARRRAAAITGAVLRGDVDPDEALWPVAKKPNTYFW